MREQGAKPEELVAKIAAQQHGVVSASQLERSGIGKDGISRRVQAGRLHRLHRGVYAVGHTRLPFEGRCMAAVLALGESAVVSHQSAAALWGMLGPTDGPIHITLPNDGGRKGRRGITIHRSCTLVAAASTRRRGIRVTNPARTLRDLHRAVTQPGYRQAVRRALDLRLISSDQLRPEDDLSRSELEGSSEPSVVATAFPSQR